jgi:hypothetical protein
MKSAAAVLALSLALLLGLVALAVPASAVSPATVPTWHVGQAVGYGTTLNLTSLVQPLLDQYKKNATASGASVNVLTFTGSLDVWVYDQVTDATSTLYTLSEQSASGFKFRFIANLTASLPVPGTYAGDNSTGTCLPSLTMPMADRAIAVTVDWSALENGTSMSAYQVSDLSTTKQIANATARVRGTLDGINVPIVDFNKTTCEETISYAPQNLVIDENTQSQTRITYEPAMNYFDFPITDNKTWWANSTATVGGTVSGTIDLQGLTSAEEQAFFQNLSASLNSMAGIAVTGLDQFPIDLSKITGTAGLDNVLQNGIIQDYPLNITQNLRATAAVRTLGDQNQHPVYLITPASYTCPTTSPSTLPVTYAAMYAPDYPAANAGMIAGYEGLFCLGSTSQTVFSLGSVPASQVIGDIEQTRNNYNPFPQGSTNANADFFFAAPYLGLILMAVAVVVVAVAALLVLRGHRKRRMAAPPSQPSMPPQSPPPPPGPP